MLTVHHHYEQLLGPVYTWMAGGFEAATARNRQLFDSLRIAAWPKGLAVDLGSGSGFQSIPLAEIGYRVLALDLCEPLLAELRGRAGSLPVRTICSDLSKFTEHIDTAPSLIICMGDTLTHLDSLETVTQLFREAARSLIPGGRLVLTFRDLATNELKGSQRFIPVRSEPDRIFTCFLDYKPGHVEVNDLLYERTGETWKFSASSYRKLRLNAPHVIPVLVSAGFTIDHASTDQGLVRIVALNEG